jgi:hypothetical protein
MKVSVGSLMCDVEPVHDDVAGQDFQATVLTRWLTEVDPKITPSSRTLLATAPRTEARDGR